MLHAGSLRQSGAVSDSRPSFEVASMKSGGEIHRSRVVANGTLTVRNESLFELIEYAYGMQRFQMVAPEWTLTTHYDIFAKAAGRVPESTVKLMLQSLLQERVKLSLHRETRQMDVVA